jgi:nucleoside-diphosphate-sugar epimerase
MIVALTGATGFVGRNLLKYFEGDNVVIKTLTRGSLEDISTALPHDLTALIHLAGKAHDLKSVSAPKEYYEVNFQLTKQLYDSFLSSDATKFIFISSVKAAADKLDNMLTEVHHSDPKTHYGKSKLMAEECITSQLLPEGKSIYILRPCMIHGPGNKGNLNLLYSFVSKGIPYPLSSFKNQRSFLSVENLCFIIKEILERDDIPSGIYNVADDEPLSTNEVVSLLAQAEGKKPRLLGVPKSLISLIAMAGDVLHLPLTTERLHKLTENFVVSNEKIKSVLKKDLPLSAREGILKTARSFKDA